MNAQEKIKNYFTDEQLAQLAHRKEQVGEEAIANVQAEWPKLISDVQAEMTAGTSPDDPRVQKLAQRWMQLLESFHGGNAGLRDSLYRMQAENSTEISQQYGGPTPELIAYIKTANAAGGS